jgi:hypothetical protein
MDRPTFSGNNIVKSIVARELLLDKGTDNVLVTIREHQSGERILAPAYWANIRNIELSWEMEG